jgi:hypothetical protein
VEEIKEKPGRKKVSDKKKPVTVYIKKSIIDSHGGMSELRSKILQEFDR